MVSSHLFPRSLCSCTIPLLASCIAKPRFLQLRARPCRRADTVEGKGHQDPNTRCPVLNTNEPEQLQPTALMNLHQLLGIISHDDNGERTRSPTENMEALEQGESLSEDRTCTERIFLRLRGKKKKTDLILRKLPFLPTCVSLYLNANIFGLLGCHIYFLPKQQQKSFIYENSSSYPVS